MTDTPDCPDGEGAPDSGVGRDIRMEVGRFACVCGNEVIEPTPIGEYVELRAGTPEYPFMQDTLECEECGRMWAIVDDGVHWESQGGPDD